jgi:hypothetical protein
MDKGESPGGSTYSFLWLCVKHLKRDKVSDKIVVSDHVAPDAGNSEARIPSQHANNYEAPNWAEIAKKCNTTTGAASKRYSRST